MLNPANELPVGPASVPGSGVCNQGVGFVAGPSAVGSFAGSARFDHHSRRGTR